MRLARSCTPLQNNGRATAVRPFAKSLATLVRSKWTACVLSSVYIHNCCRVLTQPAEERDLPGRECGITASPALRVIGRSHRAGDATYNNGRPRLRHRSTARLEQSAGRDLLQSISGCLQTFTQNSRLYSVFLLTLFLITFSPCADDIAKCP